MGLNSDIMLLLLDNAWYACFDRLPHNIKRECVIVDMTGALHSIGARLHFIRQQQITAGNVRGDRAKQYTLGDYCESAVRFIVNQQCDREHTEQLALLFDESQYAPENKYEEQKKRKKSSEKKQWDDDKVDEFFNPWGTEDIQNFFVGINCIIPNVKSADEPNTHKPDYNGMLSTQTIRSHVQAFLSNELQNMPPPSPKCERIFIDGYYHGYDGSHVMSSEKPTKQTMKPACQPIPGNKPNPDKLIEQGILRLRIEPNRSFTSTSLPSSRVGEGDHKFVYHILDFLRRHHKKGTPKSIMCVTDDSDVIAILLLNMREFIDPVTGNFPKGWHLVVKFLKKRKLHHYPTTSEKHTFHVRGKRLKPKKDKDVRTFEAQYVDIIALFRILSLQVLHRFPHVTYPVEHLISMLVMAGTDFVNRPFGLSGESIWTHFWERSTSEQLGNAQRIMANYIEPPFSSVAPVMGLINTNKLPTEANPHKNQHWEPYQWREEPIVYDEGCLFGFMAHIYIANNITLPVFQLSGIMQSPRYQPFLDECQREHDDEEFREAYNTDVALDQHGTFFKSPPKQATPRISNNCPRHNIPHEHCAAECQLVIIREKRSSKSYLCPPEENVLMATIRRMVWNIHYMRNGWGRRCGSAERYFHDPTEKNPQTNLSNWGWEWRRDDDEEHHQCHSVQYVSTGRTRI